MTDPPPTVSRRNVLRSASLAALGTIAGCNTELPGQDSDIVVFSDDSSPSVGRTGSNRSDRTVVDDTPQEGIDVTETAPPEAPVYDGGDLASFSKALESLVANGGGKLVVEPGTYQFDPMDRAPDEFAAHGNFYDLRNVTIAGNGATVVFTDPSLGGFNFHGGNDLTIRNLSLDYDPIPFTQGTITEWDNGRQRLHIELDADVPRLTHRMFDDAAEVYGLIHRSDGEFVRGLRKRGSWDPIIDRISAVDAGTYDLRIADSFASGGLEPGRRLTVVARNNRSAIRLYQVAAPTLERVTIHASNGGGIIAQVCEDPVVREGRILPPADTGRHIGTNADGIQIVNCRSSVTVEGCRHEYLGDDSLVVQHTMSSVTEVHDDRTIAVENIHPFVVAEDDVLECMSPAGVRKGRLPHIESYTPSFPTEDAYGKPDTITFADDVGDRIAEGDFVRNTATGSQNFEVRNNEFYNHRANLIRIAASHGVVEENTLVGCPINPIELETDTYGYYAPKGWVSDVVVRNNDISRAGLNYVAGSNPAGIRLHHRTGPEYRAEGRPNRDVTIVGNTISDGAAGGIHVAGSENVRVETNQISGVNALDFPGFADIGVSLDDVRDVAVVGNRVAGTADELDYFGYQQDSGGIETTDNRLLVDGESSAGVLVSLVPVRFAFDRTVRPSNVDAGSTDDRQLAFRCRALGLLDAGGRPIVDIDVGTDDGEGGVAFGDGVWPPSTDAEWRWFGGQRKTAVLYFADEDLEAAAAIRLEGYPMVAGISAEIEVGGRRIGSIDLGRRETQVYTLSVAD